MADAVEGRLGSECLGLIERQVGVDRSVISKASPPPALLGQSHIDGSSSHTRQAQGKDMTSVTAPVRMSGIQKVNSAFGPLIDPQTICCLGGA